MLVGLHHQLELFVLDLANLVFVALDLVADCLELVILARLILLSLEPCDALGASAHVQLKFLPIHLDVSRFLLERFKSCRARSQLRFKAFPLQRHGLYFGLDLPDLLLSILKNEQLFQFRMHAR